MSRIIDRPLKVIEGADGTPARLAWRTGWHQVRKVIDHWRETGRWWDGESEKTFYLVETGGPVVELYRDSEGGTWSLYRIYD